MIFPNISLRIFRRYFLRISLGKFRRFSQGFSRRFSQEYSQRRNAPRYARPEGITFIEVLVVMIILALIAGIVGTQLLGEAEKAKVNATKIQIHSLESALALYRLHNSTYPTSDQGLRALLSKPDVGTIPEQWQGPYIKANRAPRDGFGHEFVYLSGGRDYEIISFGKDGQEGGSELDADISSKDL